MKKTSLNKLLRSTAITISALFFNSANAGNLTPSNLLQLDQTFTHHILVAEKSTHMLHVFKNENGKAVLEKSYPIASGKKAGDKQEAGDFRTPEGIYFLTDFIPKKQLLTKYGKEGEIYGAGAFVTDFPNIIDLHNKKTGTGIWLHSTNDETRIDKGLDSRGCVVATNNDLKDLSSFIELGKTNLVIVHDLTYLNDETLAATRNGIIEVFKGWINAWGKEDLASYSSFYDARFKDEKKGPLKNYLAYKKNVFANPGIPQIGYTDLSILQSKEYAVVTFKQHYKSETINDAGKKVLYLAKDGYYNWKIISERFFQLNEAKQSSSFEPSMRFFKETVSVQNKSQMSSEL